MKKAWLKKRAGSAPHHTLLLLLMPTVPCVRFGLPSTWSSSDLAYMKISKYDLLIYQVEENYQQLSLLSPIYTDRLNSWSLICVHQHVQRILSANNDVDISFNVACIQILIFVCFCLKIQVSDIAWLPPSACFPKHNKNPIKIWPQFFALYFNYFILYF